MGNNVNNVARSDMPSVIVDYNIRKGDTLYGISQATGIPISILAKDNEIKDPSKIKAGQSIMLAYHPRMDELCYTPKMNAKFPDVEEQEEYLEEIDKMATEHYQKISEMGAQEYNKQNPNKKASIFNH